MSSGAPHLSPSFSSLDRIVGCGHTKSWASLLCPPRARKCFVFGQCQSLKPILPSSSQESHLIERLVWGGWKWFWGAESIWRRAWSRQHAFYGWGHRQKPGRPCWSSLNPADIPTKGWKRWEVGALWHERDGLCWKSSNERNILGEDKGKKVLPQHYCVCQ